MTVKFSVLDAASGYLWGTHYVQDRFDTPEAARRFHDNGLSHTFPIGHPRDDCLIVSYLDPGGDRD